MIKKQYALLDMAAQVYLNPLTFTTDAEAIRWFEHAVNEGDKEKSNLAAFPHQFVLFRLGDFDDQLGKFTEDMPKEIMTGVAVQKEQEKSFTVRDLVTMLTTEIKNSNVFELKRTEEQKHESI